MWSKGGGVDSEEAFSNTASACNPKILWGLWYHQGSRAKAHSGHSKILRQINCRNACSLFGEALVQLSQQKNRKVTGPKKSALPNLNPPYLY